MLPIIGLNQLEHSRQFIRQQIRGLCGPITFKPEAHEPGKRPEVPGKFVLNVFEQKLPHENETLGVSLVTNEINDDITSLFPGVHNVAEEEGRYLEFTDRAVATTHGLKDSVAVRHVQSTFP